MFGVKCKSLVLMINVVPCLCLMCGVCDWSVLGYASRLCLWQKCSNSCFCMVCDCWMQQM